MNAEKDYLLVLGIMTGNSLDACDVVLTKFYKNKKIEDVIFHSKEYMKDLFNDMKSIREEIVKYDGKVELLEKDNFQRINDKYINLIYETIKELIKKTDYKLKDVDLIGFHGQTCAHKPPSISNGSSAYTVQIGDGQKLADMTGIVVAHDFRSDDIFAGGEGAPLAPMHNKHIADSINVSSVAFLNGGNTSNISLISKNKDSNNEVIMGWDAGPFNHFSDFLMRKFKNENCDYDGKVGLTGKINRDLLKKLFFSSVVDIEKNNFLLKLPPKSSDPTWYSVIPELESDEYRFEDKIRTVQHFSSYVLFHSLQYIPLEVEFPSSFLVFGGGWKNPVILEDFRSFLSGDFKNVLEEHINDFNKIKARIGDSFQLKWSDDHGFSGEAMEARLVADLARSKVCDIPFSIPSTTGVKSPTILGILKFPDKNIRNSTSNLQNWLSDSYKPEAYEICYSRASNN